MKYKRLLSVFILLLAINFLPVIVIWIPQRFVFGLNPFARPVFQIIILLVALPFVIKWYRWVNRNWFTENDKEPVILFALAGLCWIILYMIYGNDILGFQFHDTYYFMTSISLVLYVLIIFFIFCIFYYTWPVIFKRHLIIKLSRIHFWITYIGLDLLTGKRNTVTVPFAPRRYIEYQGWASFSIMRNLDKIILAFLILIMIAQFLFLFNITYSLFNKAKR
jgi:cytochrome c oxidase subunit 1